MLFICLPKDGGVQEVLFSLGETLYSDVSKITLISILFTDAIFPHILLKKCNGTNKEQTDILHLVKLINLSQCNMSFC